MLLLFIPRNVFHSEFLFRINFMLFQILIEFVIFMVHRLQEKEGEEERKPKQIVLSKKKKDIPRITKQLHYFCQNPPTKPRSKDPSIHLKRL